VNGSGLSPQGRITPRALVDLLSLTHRKGSRSSALLGAMARAGGEGTMRRRVTFSDGRVVAKTGTLAGATALSGIIASADGRREVGFSILINGGHARSNRALQDRIVASIVRRLDGLGDPEPLEESSDDAEPAADAQNHA
jgi:D-alanyl-D-alanine carboxypeptidase/D-alanyl-D-alanine-endopeptidase (penicillin-binding protein 4)